MIAAGLLILSDCTQQVLFETHLNNGEESDNKL